MTRSKLAFLMHSKLLMIVATAIIVTACGGGGDQPGTEEASDAERVSTASGLEYQDLIVGTGATPKVGQTVVVHYTGWLTNGKKFDSSHDRNKPFEFPIGRGRVIKGWDEGVATMQVGGKRKLWIPADLGYGNRGFGTLIPAGSNLIFEVELLGIK